MAQTSGQEGFRVDQASFEAFAASYGCFSEAIAKLEASHRALEQRFDEVNRELAAANRRLQESLAQRDRLNGFLQGVLESLGSGVVAVDAAGRVSLVNRAACGMLGACADLAAGAAPESILGEAAAALRLTLQSGQGAPPHERLLQDREGRPVPVRLSTSPLGPGTPAEGAIAVFEDVSRLHDLAVQASRVSALTALGEMSATVAHEIRNPLGGIGGFAGLLERDLDVSDPRRRLVKKILDGVDSLNRIVSGLLNYTRPLQLNLRPSDFVEVVEDCLGFFEIDAGARAEEIEVVRDYAAGCVPCRIDPEQVQQVFLNLLHNAVQAIPGPGRIRVRVGRAEAGSDLLAPCAVLAVADSGVGMSQETLDRLFRPFFTTKVDGNGLGLATAKKVVEAHGGRICVQSRPNEGSEFTVYLPA